MSRAGRWVEMSVWAATAYEGVGEMVHQSHISSIPAILPALQIVLCVNTKHM